MIDRTAPAREEGLSEGRQPVDRFGARVDTRLHTTRAADTSEGPPSRRRCRKTTLELWRLLMSMAPALTLGWAAKR